MEITNTDKLFDGIDFSNMCEYQKNYLKKMIKDEDTIKQGKPLICKSCKVEKNLEEFVKGYKLLVNCVACRAENLKKSKKNKIEIPKEKKEPKIPKSKIKIVRKCEFKKKE